VRIAAGLMLTMALTTGSVAATSAAGVPKHVLTGMHQLCYGTKCYHAPQQVPLHEIAPILNWALADAKVTQEARRLGIHTYAYVDPSIQFDPKQDYSPLYSEDESTFLRGCSGSRATIRRGDLSGFFMDQGSPAYRSRVRAYVDEEMRGKYDALFVDDVFAAHFTFGSVTNAPCSRSFEREREATFGLWSHLGMPVIFNGLGDAPDDGRTDPISQAALAGPGALGGMYEFCLSTNTTMDHTLMNKRVDGAWRSAENSHLETVAQRKMFVCYAGSDTPGDSEAGRVERAYVYASFLLVYQPAHSVLELAASSARRRVSVFPETTLVALQPRSAQPRDVDALRTPTGAYAREYARCYVHGVAIGKCAAVVNPSATQTVAIGLHGYAHALALHGGAIPDGGTVSTDGARPAELPPATGAVLLR
jgi:hypothetical protein